MINQRKRVSIIGIVCVFLVLSWMTGCDNDPSGSDTEIHDMYETTIDGVLGTVNLSGGVNYTDINSDSLSARHSKWISDCGEYGRINMIPTLWIYSPNDQSIPGDISLQMFQSFRDNGGQGTFIMKPNYSTNGHMFLDEPGFYMSDLLAFFDSIGVNTAN